MQTAIILFILVLAALLIIALAMWVALIATDYWKNNPEEEPEIEIWSSEADSLSR